MNVALSEVRRINYIVTINDVVAGRLSELRDKGVNYTLVCAKGTGRSVNAADFADREIEMPVVAISGGAYFIEFSRYFNEIVEQILVGPALGIILDYEEIKEFPRFYGKLHKHAKFVVASCEEAMSNMRQNL